MLETTNNYIFTQRNDPLVAGEKSFCENPLAVKRISFEI